MTRSVNSILLLGALALAACGSPTAPDERARLEQARAVWYAKGLASYRFELTRLCECLPAGRVKVTVEQGVVSGGEYPESGNPVEPALLTYLPTVPDLFDLIEAALDQGAVSLAAEYDSRFGFPLHVSIDYSAALADDEIELIIRDLAALDGELRAP